MTTSKIAITLPKEQLERVHREVRAGRTQLALARFLRAYEVEIVSLDEQLARSCGELCAATETFDVIDASVVILARERGDIIVTSDADDLRRLDPTSSIFQI